MPRSGTTLAEQILSSHKKVYGAGELSFLEFAVKEILKVNDSFLDKDINNINIEKLKKVQQEYINGIDLFNYKEEYIVDK